MAALKAKKEEKREAETQERGTSVGAKSLDNSAQCLKYKTEVQMKANKANQQAMLKGKNRKKQRADW